MKKIMITKELFKSSIEALQQQRRHDAQCIKALRVVFPADHIICGYNNDVLEEALIAMLKQTMDDDNRHSWIDYYIYELDFGKSWKESSVTIDNKPIKLKTVDDLWDLLTMEEEEVDFFKPRSEAGS